jgi:hypothetical protein
MSRLVNATFLRRILLVDAAVSGTAGLVMVLAAVPLQAWTGVPAGLLRYAGACLLPFAGLLVALARTAALPRGAVTAVIAANGAWVAASVLVLFTDLLRPSALGYVFVLGQALAVAVLAEMETVGLKRATAS